MFEIDDDDDDSNNISELEDEKHEKESYKDLKTNARTVLMPTHQ